MVEGILFPSSSVERRTFTDVDVTAVVCAMTLALASQDWCHDREDY